MMRLKLAGRLPTDQPNDSRVAQQFKVTINGGPNNFSRYLIMLTEPCSGPNFPDSMDPGHIQSCNEFHEDSDLR